MPTATPRDTEKPHHEAWAEFALQASTRENHPVTTVSAVAPQPRKALTQWWAPRNPSEPTTTGTSVYLFHWKSLTLISPVVPVIQPARARAKELPVLVFQQVTPSSVERHA